MCFALRPIRIDAPLLILRGKPVLEELGLAGGAAGAGDKPGEPVAPARQRPAAQIIGLKRKHEAQCDRCPGRHALRQTRRRHAGLHGNKGAIPIMIEGLKSASQLEYAEQGWNVLTDVKLPQVPRMYLASESDEDSDEESEFNTDNEAYDDDFDLDDDFNDDENDEENAEDTVPDVMVAEQWWADNNKNWQHENRYLKGQLAHAQGLAKTIQAAAGLVAADLLDALVLQQTQEQQQPLASTEDHSDSWCEHRNEFLKQTAKGEGSADIASAQSNQTTQTSVNHARTTQSPNNADRTAQKAGGNINA